MLFGRDVKTIGKHISNALKEELDGVPSPKLKNTQAKVIFLTDEELEKIKTFQIPETKQYLERVRDVLIFCCYTGLRYSDVANLRTSDVKENHIEITTVKTADSLIIELNRHSRAILEKYKDVVFDILISELNGGE